MEPYLAIIDKLDATAEDALAKGDLFLFESRVEVLREDQMEVRSCCSFRFWFWF